MSPLAVYRCPECEKVVPSDATSCPACGFDPQRKITEAATEVRVIGIDLPFSQVFDFTFKFILCNIIIGGAFYLIYLMFTLL